MKTAVATGDDEPNRADQLRRAILRMLELRFGSIPAAIVEHVSRTIAQDDLIRLVHHAGAVNTLDEFTERVSIM